MTGAYLMALRDGEKKPVEVEFLTDEEIDEKFLSRTPEELVAWVKMFCKLARSLDPLLKDLERDGIIQPAPAPDEPSASPETS